MALEYSVPVVQPSWICECWNQQALTDVRQHFLPVFSGCLISVTGLSTSK